MDVMLEFRAGIAVLTDGHVNPDPRKGMVRIGIVEELVHFQWLARQGMAAIEPPKLDIVVFPGEADISKDVQPGSRYLHLKFKDASRESYFFWMQEPNADQDESLCSLAQQLLNTADEDGAEPMSQPASDDEGMAVNTMVPDLEQELAASGSQPASSQLGQGMQLGGVATGGVQPALTQEYLAAILSGIASQSQTEQQREHLPLLSEILTPQNLIPLMQDEAVKSRLGELVEYLPKEHQAEAKEQAHEAAVASVRSAPLRNQIRTLSHALASGQLDFSQFGLEHLGYTAADFLKSIQKMADQKPHK